MYEVRILYSIPDTLMYVFALFPFPSTANYEQLFQIPNNFFPDLSFLNMNHIIFIPYCDVPKITTFVNSVNNERRLN